MPRPPFVCSPENYYHVVNRAINRDWFGCSMEEVWEIVQDELYFVKRAFELNIYCFVLMSNHFHLLVKAPLGNLSDGIGYFQSQSARRIQKGARRLNHIWAHRFGRSEIDRFQYFLNCYKYIYQNPLRAGFNGPIEAYPFSTLPGLLGLNKLIIPVEEDTLVFGGDLESHLAWLNTPVLPKDEVLVKRALRRSKFQYPRSGGYPNELEERKI